MSLDADPFVLPVDSTPPQTPTHTGSTQAWVLRYTSPSRTHPSESPILSPPAIGLRLGKRMGRSLIREGAVILDAGQHTPTPATPPIPKYYKGMFMFWTCHRFDISKNVQSNG